MGPELSLVILALSSSLDGALAADDTALVTLVSSGGCCIRFLLAASVLSIRR